jgi:hypothetical protein
MTGATLVLGLVVAVAAPAAAADALLASPALAGDDAPAAYTSPVGLPVWIRDLVIPGPELQAAPVDTATPVIVRVAAVWPHGDALRYDLEVYGLDPGRHDLADHLARKDGSPVVVAGMPDLSLQVDSVLAEGQVQPSRPPITDPPAVGGYGSLVAIGGALWVAGLVALLAWGRRRKVAEEAPVAQPLTVADRLRPLVDRAMAGTLGTTERAELERTLIAFWRQRKGLDETSAVTALTTLRDDDEAGPLLRQLESWLHRPSPSEAVDVAALLRPYQQPLTPDTAVGSGA